MTVLQLRIGFVGHSQITEVQVLSHGLFVASEAWEKLYDIPYISTLVVAL
jgi:hypothetical protein